LNGYACAFLSVYGYGVGGFTVPNTTLTSVVTIATAAVGDEIKVAGATVLLRMSFSMRSNSTTDTILSVQVRDVTAGNVTKWERIGAGSGDTAGYYVPANDVAKGLYWVPGPTIEFSVTVPATGTRSYDVRMAAPTNVPLRIRDLTFAMVGTVA